MRVALDTNVLVSAVATRGICADILNAVVARHQLVVGRTALEELRKVLREKLRAPRNIIDEFEAFLRRHAEIVTASQPAAVAGLDPGDRMILAEALAAQSDALITGDRDLLALADEAPIRILSPRGFWELLRTSESSASAPKGRKPRRP